MVRRLQLVAVPARKDVVDDGDALRVTAELPGMDREDLQTSIEDGVLVLRGEKKQDTRSVGKRLLPAERSYGSFTRTIPLPDGVDVDKVGAKFDKGVLKLRLPKTASAPSAVKKIGIRTGRRKSNASVPRAARQSFAKPPGDTARPPPLTASTDKLKRARKHVLRNKEIGVAGNNPLRQQS